jgi:HD-like signal output (HDOD) protein
MLRVALPTLAAWTQRLRDAAIPVLAGTAEELALLQQMEEVHGNVDARMVADAIGTDPLMTLKVLTHVARHRPGTLVTDADTVKAAVMVMGIGPFFHHLGDPTPIDVHLVEFPDALAGLERVLARARRAARFALSFAVHRMDNNVDVVHEAALLHDLAEMMLWCHAPVLALEIEQRLQADAELRSAQVQRDVLNVELVDLEQALMRTWRLPDLLIRITDDHARGRAAEHPQVRMVRLAVQLARHTQNGWDNAALPDDVAEIAQLLTLSVEATQRLLADVDHDA